MVSAGWPVKLALRLGRFLPLWGAPLFAAVLARLNVWLRPDVYRHAEANLRHVLGRMFLNATCGGRCTGCSST
jgi:hypothetical protein